MIDDKQQKIDEQAKQIRALIAKRGPACPETKRRAAALLSATLAGGVAAPPPAPPPAPPAPPPATRGVLALLVAGLLALVVGVVVGVGCVPVEAVDQCDTEAAIAHGHATDESLPIEARQIGADGSRAWRAQRIALTGEDVPGAETWPPLPPELAPVTSTVPR